MKTKLLFLIASHLGLAAVVAQPVITNQPQSQTNIAGATVTFSVGATGTPPLSYQWVFNSLGNRLSGATNDTLILPNVQASNTGIYRVVITNDSGSVQSASVRLTVVVPPSITQHPVNQVAEVGDDVAFSVGANGTAPLSFQWLFNGQSLAGQTRTNIAWTSVQLSNAGNYSVIVTNSVGSITSQVATLTVEPSVFTKITTGSIVNDGGGSFAASWGDYDNDGFVDLFVCNGTDNTGVERDYLYHNTGNGAFMRITSGPPVNAGRWAAGAAWGDYDNDGRLDLFVSRPGAGSYTTLTPNTLYHNEGNSTFTSITTGLVVTEPMHSHAGIWGDFDNDGFLDIIVANFGGAPPSTAAPPNFLYRGRGDGTFDRLSFGTKSPANGDSWNVAAADFNNDGWLDLCIPQGGARSEQRSEDNLLYANRGDGTFALLTNSAVVANRANGVACAWGDYDNDGFLDLFVSNFYGQDNFLYHNNGDGNFMLVTNSITARDGGTSVGCAWADYDNDGWLDLFVANLGPVNPTTGVSIGPENNFLYHNNGDGTFAKITHGKPVNDLGYSTGCAWADYDNDGFLDLFVANGWGIQSENNFLYRNNGNTNNWINFKLVGTASNRSAIGAKVRVLATAGGRTIRQMREVSGGSNYGSQNDLRANFGLGDATNVDTVRIEWPSGTVQEFQDVTPRQFLTITEPPRLTATRGSGQPQFTLKGGRNMQYDIEASSALTAWSLITTVTITNGTALITDPALPDAQQKFYRAVAR